MNCDIKIKFFSCLLFDTYIVLTCSNNTRIAYSFNIKLLGIHYKSFVNKYFSIKYLLSKLISLTQSK